MNTCLDCGSKKFDLDDRLGEFVCNACGLVAISGMIEETTPDYRQEGELGRTADRGKLGSFVGKEKGRGFGKLRRTERYSQSSHERTLNEGIKYCNMVLSDLTEGTFSAGLKETIGIYYKKVITAHLLRGYSYEIRAASIVFFTLKEYGYSLTIQECAKKIGVLEKPLFKCARIVARFFEKPHLLAHRNVSGEIEKYCQEIKRNDQAFVSDARKIGIYLEQVYNNNNWPITKTFFAVVIYITTSIRRMGVVQHRITDATDITEVSLRNNMKKVLTILGIPNRHLLQVITVEQFVSGVRYD